MQGGVLPRRLQPCFRITRYSLRSRPHSTAADALGPLEQDEHRTRRVRKGGASLPVPPLLDPIITSARGRWEQPKARPDPQKFTPFQKKLYENAYAHILASPIRQDRFTTILLPNALTLALHPRPHPETKNPWLLPVDLTTKSKVTTLTTRFALRQIVVKHIGRKERWKSLHTSRLIEKLGESQVQKMVWREDMPQLILSLLQKKLMDKLRWHIRQSGGRMVACKSAHSRDLEDLEDVSCVLYLTSLKTEADDLQEKTARIVAEVDSMASTYATLEKATLDPHHGAHFAPTWYRGPLVPILQPRLRFPPLEFRTTKWRNTKVAVYSLYDMLGGENVKELFEGSRFGDAHCIVMKRGRNSVPIEILLMQLQAYIAVPGP